MRHKRFLLADTAGNIPTVISAKVIDGDTPVQSFKKDIIREGVYTHPVHGWKLDVTTERMQGWIDTFKQMRSNGVDVEVVIDHKDTAEAIRGYVTDMFMEGNTLYGVHEMRGADAIELVKCVRNVSVNIQKDFTDGEGNDYGEAITHSAIVKGPVVPGQGEFEALAASLAVSLAVRKDRVPPTLYLNTQGVDSMDEFLKELKKLLGGDTDLTAENALDAVKTAFEGAGTAANKELTASVESLTAKVTELEKIKPNVHLDQPVTKPQVKMDPEVVADKVENLGEQLSLLVEAGKISPAARDLLEPCLAGTPQKRNLYALSIQSGGDTGQSMVKQIINALKSNVPMKAGEVTGPQQKMELSRQTTEKDEDDKAVAAKVKEMAASVSV